MLLAPLCRLIPVERAHAHHVVPHARVVRARRQRHERGRQRASRFERLADGDVLLVVVHGCQAVIGEGLRQLVRPERGQFFRRQQSIAARPPERMRIDLPAGAGVLGLALDHWHVGIPAPAVGLRLAQQQDVFRRSDAHLRAVLALLGPSEPVGLVVLAHDIGNDRDHAHVIKAVLLAVEYRLGMERADGRSASAGDVAEQDAVLDVTGVDAPRPENPQQIRR